MFERSMTIHVSNWVSRLTLAFDKPRANDGQPPRSTPAQMETGQSLTVSAVNSSGGCSGGFNLSGAGVSFSVDYNHPFGGGSTTVGVDAPTGYLSGTNASTFPGHDSVANLNLYQGVRTSSSWVVPLGLIGSPPRSNCQDFVNSLFGNNTRSASVVTTAYSNPAPNGYIQPADFTGGQMAGFTAQWAARWLTGSAPALPPQDSALLGVLAEYVSTAASNGPLTMWVPQISYQPGTSPSDFYLTGYRAFPFKSDSAWNTETVNAFLMLLASGAHFVAISATRDLPDGVAMTAFDQFFASSGLQTHHDIGNSHYTSVVNVTGTYYLDVSDDFAPEDCGLLLAFLAGRTVNNPLASNGTYNTFIQLEGWQAGTQRHNADYSTYKQTLWNISTFGACPYSEKRATTIFLAPQGWTPQPYQITRMMPYVGAYANSDGTPQAWLNTGLVTIPSDAPPLPSRYYE